MHRRKYIYIYTLRERERKKRARNREMTRWRIFGRHSLTLWFLLLQSWKIGGYRKYLRDRVTATRGGGARCAVRSCRTCAITITFISRESTPARSALRFTRVATPCSRTRVPSTRTRNSASASQPRTADLPPRSFPINRRAAVPLHGCLCHFRFPITTMVTRCPFTRSECSRLFRGGERERERKDAAAFFHHLSNRGYLDYHLALPFFFIFFFF